MDPLLTTQPDCATLVACGGTLSDCNLPINSRVLYLTSMHIWPLKVISYGLKGWEGHPKWGTASHASAWLLPTDSPVV